MVVALREVASRLEAPQETEAECRYSQIRDRNLEERLRERHRFVTALKARNIHIEELVGVWLTPGVKLNGREPKRAMCTVVPTEAPPPGDVSVTTGDVSVTERPTPGAASSFAAETVTVYAAPPVGTGMALLQPGELPVLRTLPGTALIFRCKAKVSVYVFGDIEGEQFLRTILANTIFFTYADAEDAELTASEMSGLTSPQQ